MEPKAVSAERDSSNKKKIVEPKAVSAERDTNSKKEKIRNKKQLLLTGSGERDMIGLGIDTGGTCTDAVIYNMDTKEILATGKTNTTKSNLEIGIANALDQLPQELLLKAGSFSLSTTLATNACVENKGSRAKLLVIGPTEEMMNGLEEILKGYGIDDLSELVVLDAKAENLFSEPYDPDWETLKENAPEIFADCDCVGIVQTFPDANGGRFESTAVRILSEALPIPLTNAYEISKETDILKVCASTLLNARLIPLIADFMKAVHNVMQKRGAGCSAFYRPQRRNLNVGRYGKDPAG